MLMKQRYKRYKKWSLPVKLVVYCLVLFNIGFFYLEEGGAAEVLQTGLTSINDLYLIYPGTIDTFAWLILLISFELDTNLISDDALKGAIKWSGRILRYFCYFFIILAFWGYLVDVIGLGHFRPAQFSEFCELPDGSLVMTYLNIYEQLSMANCDQFGSGPLLYNPVLDVYISQASFMTSLKLAWIDVINSGAWIIICMILEFDIRTQLKQRGAPVLLNGSRLIKGVLYFIITIIAIYWTIFGTQLDGWDAILWLVAFGFIELNLYFWQSSIQLKKERSFFKHSKV